MSLSIGKAWDETRELLSSNGKAMALLVAAFVMLPSALTAMINPQTAEGPVRGDAGTSLLEFVMALVMQAGTLAVIALALRPGMSIGESIRIGFAKLVPVIVALLIFVLPMLFVLGALLASVVGVTDAADLTARLTPDQLGGSGLLLLLVWAIAIMFIGLRLMLVSAVGVAETNNPLAMLKRSWALTRGHFWRLLGFLLALVVAIVLAMAAVGAVIGVFVALVLGEVEPMSLGALILGLATGAVNAAFLLVYATMVARFYAQLTSAPSVPEVHRQE